MNCTACGSKVPPGGTACVVCGASTRLPVPRRGAAPTVWRQAAPVVARGAALVAIGVLGEWLLRSAAKRALTLSTGKRGEKSRALAARGQVPEEGIVAVSETIVARRVVYRR